MIRLTEEQKERALELFEDGTTEIRDITQRVFSDYHLDGRSKEGRAVREFLKSQGKDYGTTKSESSKSVNLTEDQKSILLDPSIITEDMKPLKAAQIAFDDEEIKTLSCQHRVVIEFLKKHRPEILDDDDFYAEGEWYSPKSEKAVLRKINRWCHVNLGDDPEKLTSRHKKCVERLLNYMQSFKLRITMNSYTVATDRELFESEFVRSTWDKPDLTTDEINLYMMVCSNIIQAKRVQKRLDNLHVRLENMGTGEDDAEPTMRLNEHVKNTGEELNKIEKRIQDLVTKLNGDRKNRIEKAHKSNASFLFLVEEFQQKNSRDRIVRMAEMQNRLIKKEADRLESMNELKARVFGISKEELL